jgi:hypothetical protein
VDVFHRQVRTINPYNCERNINIKSVYFSHRNFKDLLEVNMHVFGCITFDENVIMYWNRKPAMIKGLGALKPSQGIEKCFECSKKSTEYLCEQCDVPCCDDCFTLVHRFSKTLLTHKRVLLGRSLIELLLFFLIYHTVLHHAQIPRSQNRIKICVASTKH